MLVSRSRILSTKLTSRGSIGYGRSGLEFNWHGEEKNKIARAKTERENQSALTMGEGRIIPVRNHGPTRNRIRGIQGDREDGRRDREDQPDRMKKEATSQMGQGV